MRHNQLHATFRQENIKDYIEYLEVKGRRVLKWIIKKYDRRECNGPG
jgi:hypothetical protein